jgi:hypothetical protein
MLNFLANAICAGLLALIVSAAGAPNYVAVICFIVFYLLYKIGDIIRGLR